MFLKKKKVKRALLRYRVTVDKWLFLTPTNSLSWELGDAAEFDNLKEAYKAAAKIPRVNVEFIENKNGKVKFMHIEEVTKWL
jgi:hypothetical protein